MPRERIWENPTGRKGPGGYRIAYYINGHGLGHAVRSGQIIRRLVRNPDIRTIIAVSDLEPHVLLECLCAGMKDEHLRKMQFRTATFDAGFVQKDSVTIDMEASLARATEQLKGWEDMILREGRWIRMWGFHMVLSDSAALPLEAASYAGIPGFAVGNFTWDWIYEPLAMTNTSWLFLTDMCRNGYSKAVGWFQLAFHPDVKRPPFKHVFPVGLVAEEGRDRRFEIARATGASPGKPWVLLSFASLDWDSAARLKAAGNRSVEYFAIRPLVWPGRMPGNFRMLKQSKFPFADMVASCDAVVSKPGYGILSSCAANRKPLVWAERNDFREAAVLEKAIEKHLCGVKITAKELYSGDIGPAIQKALAMPWRPKEPLVADGVERICNLIWELLEVPEDWTEDSDWEPVDADWGDEDGDDGD